MMESLLDEAGLTHRQLDAVAFGCGPGSFTGVRIATGVAQGVAFGCDLPVVPVSTLAALAQEMFDQQPVDYAFSALDARMGEVYWGVYRRGQAGFAERLGDETVSPVDELSFPADAVGVGVGSGWDAYCDPLTARLGRQLSGVEFECYPKAAYIARLGAEGLKQGAGVSAELALPVYLRNTVAQKMPPV